MERLILASKSPRRAELLARMGIEFTVCAPEVDEQVSGEPAACVEELARRKARAGAELARSGWVLAADTLVFLDGQALGKPKDEAQAAQMLHALSGKTHRVLTGMCLKNAADGREFVRHDGASITFDVLSDQEIEAYIATGEPMDKAGSYAIQGLAAMFIGGLDGDYYNVMGLPVCTLATILRKRGVQLLR